MEYAFPGTLADEIARRWQTFAPGAAPPLPAPAQLRHLLETAFYASLEREEGRDLHFVLCCTPAAEILRDGFGEAVPVAPLVSPRPFNVEEIRSLAPAVSPANAAILVRWSPDRVDAAACEIAGILHVGAHLARARSGRSFHYRPAPSGLVIDVREAGELHVYQGSVKLAAMKGGRLHDQIAFSALEFLPISDILTRGEQALRPGITPPARPPGGESSDFAWTALLNTILCIVNGVKEHGHGGTVLLVAPDSEWSLPVRMKYDIDERARVLGQRFVRFLNVGFALMDRQRRRRNDRQTSGAAAIAALQTAAYAAEADLADAADLISRWSAVDGAVVLGSDLRVLGFGAEIVLDAAKPVKAFEVSGALSDGATWPSVDSESFGMRHRSALRCVAVAERTAAFVVSQDGTVSFFWKQGGEVHLKRDVNTANPNVIGG
ncbi:MAG TPA: hypothetical protein VLT86_17010 [Vicinamibacterales bacterium]|nr:hypothetical protein [Vicinamibacterales bacterium]